MTIKQLWSKCRLRIVFPKRVKIEIHLYLGWKAMPMYIIFILSLVIPFGIYLKQVLKNIVLFLNIQSKILYQENNVENI